MMKAIIGIFILFFELNGFSQSRDTLNLAKGVWRFKNMVIEGDTSIQTKYFHATDLKIKSKEFEIGLSEAYADGVFKIEKNGITGHFIAGDHVFEQMRIQKIKKNSITIKLTTNTPEYWGGRKGQDIIVYLNYKRRK